MSSPPFRVGVTRDLRPTELEGDAGHVSWHQLDAVPEVEWEFLSRDTDLLDARLIDGYDALILEGAAVPAAAVDGQERLALIARFGVGYDGIDIEACTANGVAVTIAREAVRRPVAVSALTLMLALSQNLLKLDRLTRQGRWHERQRYTGVGLVDRTVGAIGMGNIGGELFRLLEPFDVKRIAYDPYLEPDAAASRGVELVELDELLTRADFVVVLCPLTPDTRGLLDRSRLASMKPSAFLVNVARGPIVDQKALVDALRRGELRGAGLDVTEHEPIDPADPLLTLDNVIVTPHHLCSTDQSIRDCVSNVCESVIDAARGSAPRGLLNVEVLQSERWLRRTGDRAEPRCRPRSP